MSRLVRKPIVLVVDDDRAVLEALEAELRSGFGDLARIEAFDRPAAVLEALDEWAAEPRTLAVAIVDQKMPGMAGVDLVRALRGHPGSAAMRAILLTGYASLENAVGAKNDARIDRFLEKPWDPANLVRDVRRLLAVHLAETGADAYLGFRRARTAQELRAMFQVRYEVYRAIPSLAHYFPENEARLAIDAFDRSATYGGVYQVTLAGERAVGTLRTVESGVDSGNPVLVDLVEGDAELKARALAARTDALPLLAYWPAAEQIRLLLSDLQERGDRTVEIGRLAVLPGARGAGREGLATTLLLMEGMAAAAANQQGIENMLLICNLQHARFYSAMGMRPAADGDRAWIEAHQQWMACLHARPEWLPPEQSARLDAIAARLDAEDRACRCANFAACLDGPYRTGDFTESDLFCPERAGRKLGTTTAAGAPAC